MMKNILTYTLILLLSMYCSWGRSATVRLGSIPSSWRVDSVDPFSAAAATNNANAIAAEAITRAAVDGTNAAAIASTQTQVNANSATGALHTAQIDALNAETGRIGVAIGDLRGLAATNRTDKLWSGGTSYMDGDGVMWEIISRPYNTLTCVQADAHPELLGGVWSEAIHPIWPAPGFFSRWPDERYPLIVFNGYRYTADWSEWYIQEQYQRDLLFIDVDGNSAHQNPFEMSEMNYAGGSIWMLKEPAGVTTNIITRLATTNDIANYYPRSGGALNDGATLSIRSAGLKTTLGSQSFRCQADGLDNTFLLPLKPGFPDPFFLATRDDITEAIADMPPVVIPNEQDPCAMRLYHYGDPDIEITPAGDFGFDPLTGSVTGYAGTDEDIVLPYEINGVPVVAIGVRAFEWTDVVKTLKAPKTLTSIGGGAFSDSSLTSLVAPALTTIGDYACSSIPLTSLDAPALTTIGVGAFSGSTLTTLTAPSLTSISDGAFSDCSLTTIYYGGNQPTAGANIYNGAPANLVNYVTDPTATGWGDMFGGRPVVRLPLYADEVYSGGSLVSTVSPSSHWTTNIVASGAQTLKGTWGSQPRLQLSGSTTVDIDWTTYDTNGINRISMTIICGAHSVTWSTNNIEFATAPELSTNAPNTILIRKIGAAKAQGRQL